MVIQIEAHSSSQRLAAAAVYLLNDVRGKQQSPDKVSAVVRRVVSRDLSERQFAH